MNCLREWHALLRMAGAVRLRLGTERPQIRNGIRQTDHCQRSGLVLAVEGRRTIHRESACGGIIWVVEPEADMKGIGWRQLSALVDPKDLVEQDGFDLNLGPPLAISLDVRLIPGHAHIRDSAIHLSVGKQRAFL